MKTKFQSDSSAGRILKNGVFTAAQFGIYILSGVFFIPFLVRQYGSGSYGLIALAGFLTQYVGLISRCVGNSIARFLNIALNRHDWDQANEIFNTALVVVIVSILVQIPLFVAGVWKLDWIIDFPPEIAGEFRLLVICNIAVFFNSLLTGVFKTPVQAANRLDISATMESLRLGIRIAVLYALIRIFGAKLWFIGVVDLGLSIIYSLVTITISRRLAGELFFSREFVTRKWIRPLANMAGWSIVMALGAGLFIKTDVWMINRFVDKEMAGIYAALLVWPNFLKQISKQLAAVLAPVYMIDYARGDMGRIAGISLFSAKVLGCLAGVAVGGLYVLAEPLLRIWLGDWAAGYADLLRMMTLYIAFTIGEAVLWQIYIAMNKVHYTGIINLIAGIVNVAVSLTLIFLDYGAMGVAIGTVISVTLASTFAVPLGVCRLLNISSLAIWKNHFSTLCMLIISLASVAAAVRIGQHSIPGAVLTGLVLLIGGTGLAVFTLFSRKERDYMYTVVARVASRLGFSRPADSG